MLDVLVFVSKRLQRVTAAVICLVLAQALAAWASAPAALPAPSVTVSISR
ncbi:MAG: hypothetical protein WCI21_09425 [Alphaproteobacteria bacterium]